jgi:hypothetical protein
VKVKATLCAAVAQPTTHDAEVEVSFQRGSFKISPDHDATFPTESLENRIKLYDRCMSGWLLEWAAELNNHAHAGFAVLQLGLAYFEAHAIHCADKRRTSEMLFKHGVRCVFPGLHEGIVQILWRDGRHALFHQALVRERLVLADGAPTFRYSLETARQKVRAVLVDRYGFVEAIRAHHARYVAALREPAEAERQARFTRGWEIVRARPGSRATSTVRD